ncbi:MAG: CinA family protein [Alphaproteobacteria bacterium]|nr:CinA family protein [Alphaproteobacteria bacterium]
MDNDEIESAAETLIEACKRSDVKLATAESCTGGLIAGALTAVPGSSAVFERGFVTYSNAAKIELLGVPAMLVNMEGAVSEKVARAMAEGALARSAADLAVAVTGIAGPDGGSDDKPVGLVHLACAGTGRPTVHRREVFPGDRGEVRRRAVFTAFGMIAQVLAGKG